MTATQLHHDLSVLERSAGGLRIGRTDISFYNITGERMGIDIRVYNGSWEPSAPTVLTVEAASLGAFLPWTPVTELVVPPLEPGKSTVLHDEVSIRPALPMGDFDEVPPQRLLKAVSAGDDPDQTSPTGRSRQGGLLARKLRGRRRAEVTDEDDRSLPPDLFSLLGRPNQHWAGNLNVFIGGKPVERHMAQRLRIYPGQTNLAMFCVGSDRDAYRFDLRGDGADWESELFDMTDACSLVSRNANTRILENDWLETTGPRIVILAVQPPVDCQAGTLDVHVTQRSSGETAIVEFGFDPSAVGPGCYTV